jgi:hypothetical protein
VRSLWFVVPVFGRYDLAQICLTQLRRTCDALTAEGTYATAVIVGDDANLDTARDLGFATVTRDNAFVTAKFNDGIQAALDPNLETPPTDTAVYRVTAKWRKFRGHELGATFSAVLDPAAESRAVARGDIRLIRREPIVFNRDTFTPPDGWDGQPADYVVPCGSDDFVDRRLFRRLPAAGTVLAFRWCAFVNETGAEIVSRELRYSGGVGIRVYPRALLAHRGYRPADEDRGRGCDTSIFVNVTRAHHQATGRDPQMVYGDLHPFQVVDWKSPEAQLNTYEGVTSIHRVGTTPADPYETLADLYPAEALEAMRDHYARSSKPTEEVAVNG